MREAEPRLWDNRELCTVVKDVDKTVAYYSSLNFGRIPVQDLSYADRLRGEPFTLDVRVGFSRGSALMEVIEGRPNIPLFSGALAKRGEGGHHIGIFVSDLAAEVEVWEKAGAELVCRGGDNNGTVEFAYVDATGIGGLVFELIYVPPKWFPRFSETPRLGTNLAEIRHVGVVVKDLERCMGFYSSVGIGPFTVRERDLANLRVAGRPGTTAWRIKQAVSQNCRLPIELIQPLGSGTIFHETLERQGEGIHHACCYVSNLAEELARLESLGVKLLMANERLAFLDTRDVGGLIIELIEWQS